MDAVKRYFRSPAAVAGLILLLIVIAMAISAGFLYPRDPLALAGRPLIWPFSNPRFLLGTDNSGRDIAAQILYGARISLTIGLLGIAISFAIGMLVGGGVPTMNFRTDYLRPAIGDGLTAVARVRRAGKTAAVVDIDVADDQGRLVAIGRGAYSSTAG